MDVTVVGDVNVDIITKKLKEIPEKDSQKVISDLRITSGGCAANFAKAVGKLGLKTRLIGKIGDDFFSEFIIKSLKDYVTDLQLKISKGKKTGVTFAMCFEDNTRSFITYPGTNAEFTLNDIDFKLIEGKYLHIASFFLQGLRKNTKKILKYAHSKNMITTFDTGWDPQGWGEEDVALVKKVLSGVDIFFPNLKEGIAITKKKEKRKICKELFSLGPKIVALKLGSKGSFIAAQKEEQGGREKFFYYYIPPYKIKKEKIVDTTGAGDVFNAAFVYGHFYKWPLKKIGNFANTAAALSTLGYGSEDYPSLEEVKKRSYGKLN